MRYTPRQIDSQWRETESERAERLRRRNATRLTPDDVDETHSITFQGHIWNRVRKHAEARQMSFEGALAELITMGFASSPAYRRF